MRRTVFVCGAALAIGGAAALAATPLMPMTARFVPTAHGVPASIILSGRLPTDAAGEKVTIFGKECAYRFYRQITGTQSLRGGTWEATVGGSYGRSGDFATGMTYRARWRTRWSVPWTFRMRKHPRVQRLSGDRFRVLVGAEPAENLNRKSIVLQRATGSGWVTFRTGRLRLVPATRGREYSATFVVRTNGMTLRALVPLKTARPCYNPGASENFRTLG